MKCAVLAVFCVVSIAPSVRAQNADDALRQRNVYLQKVLTTDPVSRIRELRNVCASGEFPERIAATRRVGLVASPDATETCVTVLTRLGRENALGYLKDTRGTTSAVRFDTGFVAAYERREALPPNLPTMAALKPVAERCLAQAEPNYELGYAVGYAFGLRAAQGEVPSVMP